MIVPTKVREAHREEIGRMCRKLILSNQVVSLCEEATPKQEEFIMEVLEQELQHRERSRKTRLLNRAKFPVLKSLEGYSFQMIKYPPSLSQEGLISCQFMQKKTNLICYGPVGTGNYVSCRVM